MIHVKNLTKIFKVSIKGNNTIEVVRRLIFPKYREVVAIKDISFSINEGEFVGYIGPNGAGKTTTLKILSGILYPTSGDVRVMGYIPYKREIDFLKNISFIMGQKTQLWWDIAPIETFKLNKAIYKIPDNLFKKRVDELANLLNVSDLLEIPVRKLSLGERMKMEIISALLHSPKILFLDEPTLGLDMFSQESIREFFINYNKEYKATIILTSHYIHDIEKMAKRIIIINQGSIVYDGDKSGIIDKFSKERVLRLKFKTEVPSEVSRFGMLTLENKNECKLKILAKDLREVIKHLYQNDNIIEIFVDEVPLEYAIKEYFKRDSVF
jgi:ABC-2 type transport system ATP-binding protein